MRTIAVVTLAYFLAACGDAPPKKEETITSPPVEQADAQKTLRVEYYEINKK